MGVKCMKCPKCKLENPSTALRCDCGYDFQIMETKESYLGNSVIEGDQKPAMSLLVCGWIFSLLGGIIGILISYTIAYGKGIGGNGYKYNPESRKVGRAMFAVSKVIFTIGLIRLIIHYIK